MVMSRGERWVLAPVALLLLDAEGRVLDANDEFLRLLDVPDVEAVAGRRLADLLTVGGRIYWETHLGPRLHIEGRVDEVAVELRTPRGREPVLLTAIGREVRGERLVEVAMLGARERSRFEHELVGARRAAEEAERRVRLLHGIAADLDAAVEEAVQAYKDPWKERAVPATPGQFRTSLPLTVLPQVPVRA